MLDDVGIVMTKKAIRNKLLIAAGSLQMLVLSKKCIQYQCFLYKSFRSLLVLSDSNTCTDNILA